MAILGQKEIARELEVRENTVNQWMVRGMLPQPDGFVSGNPAWHAETIRKWAWATGRFPDLRVRILSLLASAPNGGGFATPLTEELIATSAVGPETSPAKIASVLTDLFEDGKVSIHLRNEWRITAEGRRLLEERSLPGESAQPIYDSTPERVIKLFTQWENAAARSPNPKVAGSAPLQPPSRAEALELVRRLHQIRAVVGDSDVDWHGRPIADPDQAAMGQLWEEWRDDKLGVLNGYRDVWKPPDPFYDLRGR